VRILRSARHLLELVNDVLDISKLEAGKIQITPRDVDLAALARETLPTVQPQADAKRLVLELRAPERLPMRTDPARVRQILLNLLSNAVKFTGDGGRIVVSLEDRGPRGLALAVQDTGTGIAPEHQESIFAEFVQVGSRSDGTGLGLAISRRLARLLCGDLRVASEVGKGSTFTLTLPRDYDVSPTREDEEPAAVRPSRVVAAAGPALSPRA
jgi:signal transduction histidine kinase